MQLKKIQAALSVMRRHLRSPRAYDRLYTWESQAVFQKNWDIHADDFANMYNASLQNSHTKRLWKREAFYPKKMLLAFAETEPDFVRQMFKDLFDESKTVAGRVERFVFYCDELLQAYKQLHPLSVENNHYHDYEICSLYLAFRYPERYALYDFASFRQTMQALGSSQLPQVDDVERFCKVTKTLWNFLEKDTEIITLHRQRLSLRKHYTDQSLLLVSEWMRVLGR